MNNYNKSTVLMHNYYVQYQIERTYGKFIDIDNVWAKNEIDAIMKCIESRFPDNSTYNISDFKISLNKVY